MSGKTLIAMAALPFALAGWLFTVDIHADESRFCGSAYDVVLLKGDGFMGGEVPENQRALDRQCVRTAGRVVTLGAALGGAAVVLTGCGIVRLRRARVTSSGGT